MSSKWLLLDKFIEKLSFNIETQKIKMFITKKDYKFVEIWWYNKNNELSKITCVLSKDWQRSMKTYFKSYKCKFYNFEFDNITNFEYFFEDNLEIYLIIEDYINFNLGSNISKLSNLEQKIYLEKLGKKILKK